MRASPGDPRLQPGRRRLLKLAAALRLAPAAWLGAAVAAPANPATAFSRVRPGDPAWPDAARWKALEAAVGGSLLALESPFADCLAAASAPACTQRFASASNPYVMSDDPALTQTFGWVDAWVSRASAYAVAARHTADVVAAVDFARSHRLRLVVKGGGHSFQGTSNAADSLLVWTRRMSTVTLHDAFVPQGCAGRAARCAPSRSVPARSGRRSTTPSRPKAAATSRAAAA